MQTTSYVRVSIVSLKQKYSLKVLFEHIYDTGHIKYDHMHISLVKLTLIC